MGARASPLLPQLLLGVILCAAAGAAAQEPQADACSRLEKFQEGWSVDNPTPAQVAQYDPRKLNTLDFAGCASTKNATTDGGIPAKGDEASIASAFVVDSNDYGKALELSLYFYEVQRSGLLPSTCAVPNDPTVAALDCTRPKFRGNSTLTDGDNNSGNLEGGYWDAGDHVKFAFPLAFSMWQLAYGMLRFEAGYKAAGQWERGLATVARGLDWIVKASSYSNDPSKFAAQVGNGGADHGYWGRPEEMTMARPVYHIDATKPGTDLWAAAAAALAVGSRLFSGVDALRATAYLDKAQQLYSAAVNNPKGLYSDAVTDAAGFYRSSAWQDDVALAAASLHLATNDAAMLAEAKAKYADWRATGVGWKGWDWDNAQHGAAILLNSADPAYQPAKDELNRFVREWSREGGGVYTPGGLAYLMDWASLRGSSNAAMMHMLVADAPLNANDATRRARLYCWAQRQINYALGDNPSGMSYVVGFGSKYPQQPHHRAASCPDLPAPCGWNEFNSAGPNPQVLYGGLVGGPGRDDSFLDKRDRYTYTEVALDIQAGLQGAVAGLRDKRVAQDTCACFDSGSASCAITWEGGELQLSPRPLPSPMIRSPSPAPPSPSPRPISPAPMSLPPTCPIDVLDPNYDAYFTVGAWEQCGGRGGECNLSGCANGQCDPVDCAKWDAPWRNVKCGNLPYGSGAPMKCCRSSVWYWQCVEPTADGSCPGATSECAPGTPSPAAPVPPTASPSPVAASPSPAAPVPPSPSPAQPSPSPQAAPSPAVPSPSPAVLPSPSPAAAPSPSPKPAPSPARPSPSPAVTPSPAAPQPGTAPQCPVNQDDPANTIVIDAWGQCGGRGGQCNPSGCANGQCNPADCAKWDAPWRNVKCGRIAWNGRQTRCCRQSEWYWQCAEPQANGECPSYLSNCAPASG